MLAPTGCSGEQLLRRAATDRMRFAVSTGCEGAAALSLLSSQPFSFTHLSVPSKPLRVGDESATFVSVIAITAPAVRASARCRQLRVPWDCVARIFMHATPKARCTRTGTQDVVAAGAAVCEASLIASDRGDEEPQGRCSDLVESGEKCFFISGEGDVVEDPLNRPRNASSKRQRKERTSAAVVGDLILGGRLRSSPPSAVWRIGWQTIAELSRPGVS